MTIVTSDKDLLQLVDERIRVLNPRDDGTWYDEAAVVGRFGVTPPKVIDVLALAGDGEDLMHKACGWLLREAGKTDPARLEAFLRRHGPALPRTTVRYAIERFDPQRRARLLAETRGAPRA